MRNTPLLEAVKNILQKHNRPVSVPEIQSELKKQDIVPNKTSLYRLLEKLKNHKIIESVLLDSKTTYYELKTHHHHHFTCTKCEKINCIEDPNLETQIHALETELQQKGFSIDTHHFSLSGTCKKCNI